MDEVNRNSHLLPNKSLVFDFSADSCMSMSQLYSLKQFLEQDHDIFPNYICDEGIMCQVTLTGPNWETSAILGTILDLHKTQQVIFYGLGLTEMVLPLFPFSDTKKGVSLIFISMYIVREYYSETDGPCNFPCLK